MANEGLLVSGDYVVEADGSMVLQTNGDSLTLNAFAGDGPDGGYLAMSADNAASLTCAEGTVLVSKSADGQTSIGLKASTGGTIAQATGMPATPSQMALEPEKITISQGLPVGGQQMVLEPGQISLSVGLPGVGSSIQMTPESLTLKVAEWSLSITPTGISLAVGPSTLTVTPDQIALNGMIIDIQGITQATLKGLQTQINGEAMVQIQGGITMLG